MSPWYIASSEISGPLNIGFSVDGDAAGAAGTSTQFPAPPAGGAAGVGVAGVAGTSVQAITAPGYRSRRRPVRYSSCDTGPMPDLVANRAGLGTALATAGRVAQPRARVPRLALAGRAWAEP